MNVPWSVSSFFQLLLSQLPFSSKNKIQNSISLTHSRSYLAYCPRVKNKTNKKSPEETDKGTVENKGVKLLTKCLTLKPG